jgi:hypothetical protein
MITAYQKMVNRMKLLALGLKLHCLDNKCLAAFKLLKVLIPLAQVRVYLR